MEADWSVEVGPQLAVIDAGWPGFIDLRASRDSVVQIPETKGHQALREVLLALNAPESPLFTVKCDAWELKSSEIDPAEFDCTPADAQMGVACYVDVLARETAIFGVFARHEAWAQAVAVRLREFAFGCGRVDLVVRGAHAGGQEGFGITLYAAGCGEDSKAAHAAWGAVLRAAVAATINEAENLPLRP